MVPKFDRDLQFYKFCAYGFLKNLRFFEPFLYLFLLEKGLSFLQIGTLVTVRELVRNLLEIPSGLFADAWGRRRSMIISFIFYIGSFISFYFFAEYFLFLAAMIFYAIGDAFRTGTHKAMIFEYLKIKGWEGQKAHYYGFTRSWSQIGSGISSLAAGGLVFYSGRYDIIFLYTAIPYLINLALMVSYPKILDGMQHKAPSREIIDMMKHNAHEIWRSIKDISRFRALSNASIYSGYYRAAKDYLQPILFVLFMGIMANSRMDREKGTALAIGVVYFIIFLLTSVASRKSGQVLEHFKKATIVLNGTLVIGFSLGILSGVLQLSTSTFWLVLGAILFAGIYIVENIRKPLGVSYISEIFNKDILATTLSVESQLNSIFAALLAPVFGFIADLFGVGWAFMLISAGLLVLYPVWKVRGT